MEFKIPVSLPKKNEYNPDCLSFLLPSYYRRLFPADLIYHWLSYGNHALFTHREFSFTFFGNIFQRYLSFDGGTELLTEMRRRAPEKVHIGAVYNHLPKSKVLYPDFTAQKKEFVLDIDLTDYDDVRTCCRGEKMCTKCWKFIALAVKILDAALRDDFGFKHILWVYSGRRGVHCWVCDQDAFNMSFNARASVLSYLTVVRGGENQLQKVKIYNPDHIHHHLYRSVGFIDKVFEEICHEDQGMLRHGDKNFEILPSAVQSAAMNSPDRFHTAMAYLDAHKEERRVFKQTIIELKLQLCYPRIDSNVSVGTAHLLKSPFCIHPITGQVCVPFEAKNVDAFQPFSVPTIITLIDELHILDEDLRLCGLESINKIPLPMEYYTRTSLAPYLAVFTQFVNDLGAHRAV